eukprot:2920235-Rhodomonas_salina.4
MLTVDREGRLLPVALDAYGVLYVTDSVALSTAWPTVTPSTVVPCRTPAPSRTRRDVSDIHLLPSCFVWPACWCTVDSTRPRPVPMMVTLIAPVDGRLPGRKLDATTRW